jgi:hypothetical protein
MKEFRRFGNGKGAYVKVVGWAESPQAFEELVRRQSESLDCILVELEKVELLDVRMQADDYPDEFINLRQTAIRQPTDTVFGTLLHLRSRRLELACGGRFTSALTAGRVSE